MHGAVSGFKHCGCFGAVAVPPWETAAVDLVAAAGLLFLPKDSLLRHLGGDGWPVLLMLRSGCHCFGSGCRALTNWAEAAPPPGHLKT